MRPDARTSRAVAWALALLLFALGAAAGIVSGRTFLAPRDARRGPPTPEMVLRRMTRDLDLTQEQARAVSPVLEARWRALATLFEQVDPEAERIRADANDRIRAVLSAQQRARFDEQIAESERRRSDARERLRLPATGGTSGGSGSAR